ncbi:MAG: cofactor-independent phosphoglycerate mutase [Lachnospiraceae bacterium]|nr:cofactor-independent phosphoglycerate mutase [Lachnospiraceae bacterium]
MKYVVMLCDGMADEPIEALGGKTPLEYAKTENMDKLSKKSEIGLAHTIPEGMSPGSDTANLAVLGYDPKKYYSGRSPLEALSIGVPMDDSDIAIRCNVVTLEENEEKAFEDLTIIDHSSGEISTEDAAVLIKAVSDALANERFQFYVGTSYRHCLIDKTGSVVELTPPHDILTKRIGDYLPKEASLLDMMKKSYNILKDHPINIERKKAGKNPANCCWFWGAGTKPMLDSFEEKTGLKGAMISAVDLLKGIAVGADMKVIAVEGADGGLNTNYEGKCEAAFESLKSPDCDFVYIHVEAPDEMGHQGSYERKVKAIENIDARIIGPLCEKLNTEGIDFKMLVLPDHPTPVRLRTHTSNPIPYLLYDSTKDCGMGLTYGETDAAKSDIFVANGYTLINRMIDRD